MTTNEEKGATNRSRSSSACIAGSGGDDRRLSPTAGTAGASAPVSCTTVSGAATPAGTLTFKGCGGGLGKGTAIGQLFPAGGGTITWKGHHKGTTTLGNVNLAPQGQGGCKTGSVAEQDITGTVTADTSKAHIAGHGDVGSGVRRRSRQPEPGEAHHFHPLTRSAASTALTDSDRPRPSAGSVLFGDIQVLDT